MVTNSKHTDSNRFDAYLAEDETILWTGQPQPQWLFSSADIFLVPFSLIWGGFAISWELGALSTGSPSFSLWGIPFVIVGQYFIWGRFLYKYLRRRQTFYAVTEKRALVLRDFFGLSFNAYFLHQIPSLHRKGQSVLFESGNLYLWQNFQIWLGESEAGFYSLVDADAVYKLLQKLIMPTKP